MSNDKTRAEFEEWLSKQVDIYGLPYLAAMHKDLEYISGRTQLLWQAWRASRAAQVVELPASVCRANQYHIEYTGEVITEHDEYYEIEDVKGALDAAGVAYK